MITVFSFIAFILWFWMVFPSSVNQVGKMKKENYATVEDALEARFKTKKRMKGSWDTRWGLPPPVSGFEDRIE